MKVKALKSFTGAVSMAVGEVKKITDKVIVNDLVSAGYVEFVEESKLAATEETAQQTIEPEKENQTVTSEPGQQVTEPEQTEKTSDDVSDSDTDKDETKKKATSKRSAKKDEIKSDTEE